ncbi:MAG: diphthamide synthesis protein [Thermoproteus sp.]|nr:diphthamide synthesis protein [Thermoproteus sp.]
MELDNAVVPDEALELAGPDALIEAPPGFKWIALELARRTGAKVAGRAVWGSCDLGLAEAAAAGARRIIHLGHGVPPNIAALLRRNTGGELAEIGLDSYKLSLPSLEAYFLPVYYKPPPNPPRPPEGKIYFPVPYRLIAEELAERYKMPTARRPITGCWVGEPPGGAAAVVVASGYFYSLAVKLFYPEAEVWGYDPFKGAAFSVDERFKKLAGLKAKAYLAEGRRVIVVVSRKPGQMLLAEAAELAKRRGGVVAVFDEVSPELIDDLGADLVINAACPRIGFDDLDRLRTPVLNLHEAEGRPFSYP